MNKLPQIKHLPIPCSLSWGGLGWAIDILEEIPDTLYIPEHLVPLGEEILNSDEFVHLGIELCFRPDLNTSCSYHDIPTEGWELSGKDGSCVLSGEV